jgi:lipopolysaccharide-induced tumor necrosis factor-alpha factor
MEKSASVTTPAAAASPHTAPPAYLPQETGTQALVPTSTPGDDIHAASAPRDPAATPAPQQQHSQQGDQKQMDPMNMNPAPVQLVTPIEMLAGENPQYIDCPWCHQRALTMTRREGTSMQMYVSI